MGTTTETGMGTRALQQAGTVSAMSAQGAEMEALVKAKFSLAQYRPRSLDAFRDALLRECQRPRFAEEAEYKLPGRGGGKPITGPSIRLADVAAQLFGNVDVSATDVYEDEDLIKTRVMVLDLETNMTASREFRIPKVVERKRLRRGQQPLDTRTNSYGELVYLVKASEADLRSSKEAQTAIARRNCILQLIPRHLAEEALDTCRDTVRQQDAEDPDAARKRLLDAFSTDLGVKPARVADMIGHPLEEMTPTELEELRGAYRAIRDGACTVQELIPEAPGGDDEDDKGGKPASLAARMAKVRESLGSAPAADAAPKKE